MIRSLLICAALSLSIGPPARAQSDLPATAEAAARARRVLHSIYDREESWIKIHAAEGLVAGGEAARMREIFLRQVPTADSRLYRVGIWRVLANTAPTAADRAAAVAEVEKIYLNPASPDRSQAIETLDKLRCVPSGPLLDTVRRNAATGPAWQRPLCLWSLALAGEPGALDRLCALLQSPDATMRTDAAYALRWLRTRDEKALQMLAAAAAAEPADSKAAPYLLSAAFALHAAPAKRAVWRAGLERILASGTSDARFEACQGLMPDVTVGDLPRYQSLLDSAEPDTQVGAAWTLLYVLARR